MTKCLEPRLVTFLQDRIELFSGPASICKHTKLGGGWNLKTPRAHVGPGSLGYGFFAFCWKYPIPFLPLWSIFVTSSFHQQQTSETRCWFDSWVESCSEVLLHFHCALDLNVITSLLCCWVGESQCQINSDCQIFQFQTSETLYQVLCW